MDKDDMKAFDKMLTPTHTIEGRIITMRQSFTKADFKDGEWSYKDRATSTWSRSKLLDDLKVVRAACHKLDELAADMHTKIMNLERH